MQPLEQYITCELDRAGYPGSDMDAYWSLGYSQGDGVAWYGPIDADALHTLAGRLLSGQDKAAARRALKKANDVNVTIEGKHRRYHHYNTMRPTLDLYETDEAPLTERERAGLDSLLDSIRDDVRQLSHRLERECYAFLEASRPAMWPTALAGAMMSTRDDSGLVYDTRTVDGYRIVATLEDDEDADAYESGDIDEDHTQIARAMVEGRLGVCLCHVAVFDDDSGTHLTDAYLGSVWVGPNDAYLAEVFDELRADALDEARTMVARLAG